MHYAEGAFLAVDWTQRGEYMRRRHGIPPAVADEALRDTNRVVISPDLASRSGRSVRIIGRSVTAGEVITVIVVTDGGREYGLNGWPANERDRRIYQRARRGFGGHEPR